MATFLPTIPSAQSPAIFVKGLQNNGTTTSVAQYLSFGHCFQKAQMTAAGMTATISSTSYPCQVDVKTKYPDGSVCYAIITLNWPAVPAGATVWGQFAPAAAPSGSALSLATALGSTTASISLVATVLPDWAPSTNYQINNLIKPSANNPGGYTFQWPSNVNATVGESGTTEPTWPQAEGDTVAEGSSSPQLTWSNIGLPFSGTLTQDLIAAVKNSSDLWLSGPLAVQGRVYVCQSNPQSLSDIVVNSSLPSATRLAVDATAYADGKIVIETVVGNDAFTTPISSGSPVVGGTQAYTATITLNGSVAFTSAALVHNLSENWAWQVATVPHLANSSQDLTLQVLHNPADFIEAQAVVPYDYTVGVGNDLNGSPIVDSAQTIVQTSGFSLPLTNPDSAVATDMGNYGVSYTNEGIGPNSFWSMFWFTTQNQYFWGAMLESAKINGYVQWHLWNPNTGSYWTSENDIYLNAFFWRTPSSIDHAPPVLTAERYFSMDFEHYPDLVYIAFLATGRRYYLDELGATAAYVQMEAQSNEEGYANGLVRGQFLMLVTDYTVRSQGWGLRHTLYCAYAFPDGTVQKKWFRLVLDNNLFWVCGNLAYYQSQQGECFGWLPGNYGNHEDVAPWQQDYCFYVFSLAATMGHPLASIIAAWMTHFRAGMLLNGSDSPMSGFPPAEAIIYDVVMWSMFLGEYRVGWGAASNPPAQSWLGLEQLIRQGPTIPGSQVAGNTFDAIITTGTVTPAGTLTVGTLAAGTLEAGQLLVPGSDDWTTAGPQPFVNITGGSGNTWTTNYTGAVDYIGPMAALNPQDYGKYVYWVIGNTYDYPQLLYDTLISGQILGLADATSAMNVMTAIEDYNGIVVPRVTNTTYWQNALVTRLAARTINNSQVFPLAGGAIGNNEAQGFAMMGPTTTLPPASAPAWQAGWMRPPGKRVYFGNRR